jgi:hypothetical protein
MIQVGNRVRSFDFVQGDFGRDLEGERACYVEGIVEGFKKLEGCERYVIRVERKVWAGEEVEDPYRGCVYPPVNGTAKLFGGVCDNVELV